MSTQLLHQGLVEDGYYEGSVQQFQSDYSDKNSQQDLYNGIIADGDFDGTFLDFQNKYFPTQAATTTPSVNKPYVAPTTTTKEKSEQDLKIEQDAVNKGFWDGTGDDAPSGNIGNREDYSKINGDWYFTNPVDAKDVRKLTSGPAFEELQDEEIRIGQRLLNLKGTTTSTYNSLEEDIEDSRVIRTSSGSTFAEGEYYNKDGKWHHQIFGEVTDEITLSDLNKSDISKARTVSKKEEQETEQETENNANVISDEEELEILGTYNSFDETAPMRGTSTYVDVDTPSQYNDFVEKYGNATTSEKKWRNKEKKGTQSSNDPRYFTNIDNTEQSVGPLTKSTKSWHSKTGIFSEEVSYTNSQTGEELTEEEIKDFEKFSYIKEWDDFVNSRMVGLGEGDRKLLRKNPELFKHNKNYRSADKIKKENTVLNLEDLEKEDELIKVRSKGEVEGVINLFDYTQIEEKPFYFYDENSYSTTKEDYTVRKDDNGEFVREPDGKGSYRKRYLKWHPNTPDYIIEEYEELSKRIDKNRNAISGNEVTYHQGQGNRLGGVKDFISNKWDDKKQFQNWFDENYKQKMYALNGEEVFDAGWDGSKYIVKFANGTIYKNKIVRSASVNGVGVEIGSWKNNTNSTIYNLREAWENTGTYKKLNEEWENSVIDLNKDESKLKKEAKEFLDTKYNKYHIDDYVPSVKTYENDNNINFADDFEEEIKEINADAQAYFETKSKPIQEEIAEELSGEFLNRYIRNEKNELVDRETSKIVTQGDINTAYQNEFQKRFSSHPDVIRLKRENNALFRNTAEKFRENWKPKRELISQDWYDEIGDKLSDLDFSNKMASEQKIILDNAWKRAEQQLVATYDGDENDLQDYIQQRKHEFFNYYYDPDKYNLAYTEKGEHSRFAINTLATIKKELAEDKYDKVKNLSYAFTNEKSIASSSLDDALHLIKTADYTEEDLDGFIEGFTSLRVEEWFVPALLDKTISTYNIGKKMEEGGWESLTESEKSHMTMLNLQSMVNGRNRELSTYWHGAGKLTAEMIPYVTEFVLTSGAFTVMRGVALKQLTKAIVRTGVKGQTWRSVSKSVASKNAVKFTSWVAGTLAHTAANPQRYINATIENMTPEMQLMLSDEGDELVGIISDNGMGFEEAFRKGFLTTWAEFGTERLGQAVPMLGKYFKGKLPEGGKEFFERLIISKYMTKYGLNRSAAVSKFTTQRMGWNGLIGEVFEEVVNQPLSNIIMGNDVLEGMDERFFSELSLSMGVTQVAFGGLSLATMKKGRKTGYMINDVSYQNEAKFLAKLEKMEAEGLFESNTKIDIVTNNDMDLANRIKKQYVDKYKNKRNSISNTETSVFDQTLASEIDITNELGENVDAYGNVITIEEETSELMEIKKDIKSDPTLSTEERNQKLKDINLRLKYLHQSKNQILAPIKNKIGKRKRLETYKSTTNKVKRLIKKLGFDTQIIEKSTLEQTKKAAKADLEREMAENQEVLDNYKGDKRKKEYKDLLATQQEIQDDYAEGKFVKQIDEVTHGYISRDGKTIMINKAGALAKKGGNINVAAHEFLHRALRNMIGQNPATQIALGRSLQKHIMNIDPAGYQNSKYRQRLLSYQGNVRELNGLMQSYNTAVEAGDMKEAQKIANAYHQVENTLDNIPAEEAITLLSDAFASGDISMSNRKLSSLGKIFERIMSAFGVKATFAEGENVFDFIANFNENLEKDNFSRSMMNTLKEKIDVKGRLKEDVEGYTAGLKAQARAQAKAQFSKAEGKNEQELGRSANTPAILKKNDELRQEILRRAELDVNDPLYTGKDKNGKIIIPEDIREELVNNNLPRVTALAAQAANAGKNIELEQDKKKGFDQFFPEYYMKLYDLTRTYNPLVWNEKNKRFDEIPFGAYMNTILPLKYSGILEDLKKGEIENQVSEEEAKNIAIENEKKKEERGKLIKLYDRFGDYAKMYNLKVRKAIEDGSFNPAQENISRIGVNTIDLFPQSTQLMFGVIPKEGNLTAGDVKEGQMFINKHVETIAGILPKYDKVTIKINPKTGKPSKVSSIGLPNKLRKLFYTKGKRVGNDYVWTRNNVIDINKLLAHVGITERGKPNLYKKDTNTSQSLIGIMNLVGRMMTNQASREYFLDNNMPLENMGTLQESIGTAMFSKSANEGSISDKAIFFAGLPRFGENYKKHGRSVKKAFGMTYPEDLYGENQDQVIKEIEQYIENYSEYATEATLGGQQLLTLENYINEQTMSLSLEKNLSETTGVNIKDAFNNKDALTSVRSAVAATVEYGGITIEEVDRFLAFLGGSGNIGGTTLMPNEYGDLVKNTQHWQSKMKKAQGELDKAKVDKNKKRIKELEARIAKYTKNIAEDVVVEGQRYGLFKGVEDLRTVVIAGKNVNVKLARGLKPLLKIGSTITKKAGEDALLDLSDKLDSLDNEQADNLVSWLDSAIELMQDGYPGDATKKIKQFNQACKDALSGAPAVSAFEAKISPNTAQNVNVKLVEEVDKQAQEDSSERNKAFLRKFGKALRELKEQGRISKTDQAMILMVFGNGGMKTPIAAAAKVAYTTDISGESISSATHRYEHLIPRKLITLYFANSIIDGSAQSQLEFNNILDQFVVAIIPIEQDEIVNKAKFKDSMPNSWFIGANALQRYFNMRTFGKINLKLIDVKTGKPVVGYENFNKVHEINGDNHAKQVILNEAKLKGMLLAPAKGMSAFDFDETVGVSDNFVIARKQGETQKIPSDQWPFVGAQMVEEGWEMDFTDFNQVTKGRPGPLMQKMKNQIKKYGPENVYILTARAAESQPAIHEYLKSEGIEIPLENITGLGNSTGAAKAEWMLEKFSEGYNDMYFVDDALPNVEAVKDVLDQLDIKSSVQIARQQFSKGIKGEFAGIMNNAMLDMNRILEQTKGVKAEAVFSTAQAKIRGQKIGKYKIFLPPSAQDFKGLLYQFLAKGRVGEAQMAFFEKALIKPFARAISEINSFKQGLNNKYKAALKEFGVNEGGFSLTNLVGETNFTEEQAVRVYLFNKAGYEVPGLSKRDLKTLIEFVEANENIRSFAETIGMASEQEAGYLEPSDYWMVEGLKSDLLKVTNEKKREDFLGEWKQNVEVVFSGNNLNKIEAIYGSNFREALEDMLHAMEFGKSRESGGGRLVNTFNNWANQSVGAIMFLNMRSALLQTISSINYLNWSDNNPLKAGAALANVPQFLKDFSMIFNSDMLKQRRSGNQRGINEAELAEAAGGGKFSPKAILNFLLTKGFLPTQIADSFAISSGGASFYRNRVNTYLKEGYSQKEAEQMAFQDFQENTEESQQSSRPDMISQQQRSPLGRYILAFKNTPMQYSRLIQKSWKDLIAGRGDSKTNMGKIVYYAGVQNLIFSALSTSMGMLIGDDDEEEDVKKYERTINSMIDSLLGGLGIGGIAVSTLKNTIQEWLKQDAKGFNADHAYTLLRFFGFSPTIGSKGRKLYSAIQTDKFNRDVIKEMGLLNIDNPIYSVVGNIVSAVTNLPLDRLVKKIDNIDAALTEDLSNIERLALLMGWNTWDLDVDDSDVIAVEDEIKEKKKVKKEKQKKIKKEEKKKEIELEEKKLIEDNIDKQKTEKGEIKCAAINKAGKRCGTKIEPGQSFCTIHIKVEQGTKEVQCSKIKSDKKRCKMKTKAKSGLCYYHD